MFLREITNNYEFCFQKDLGLLFLPAFDGNKRATELDINKFAGKLKRPVGFIVATRNDGVSR